MAAGLALAKPRLKPRPAGAASSRVRRRGFAATGVIVDPHLFPRHKSFVSDDTLDPALTDDVSARPNEIADSASTVAKYVPADILARYEVYSYRNAALIISEAHPAEFAELLDALRAFNLTREIIAKPGGSESDVPKLFSAELRQHGWHETTIQADLLVRLLWRQEQANAKGKLAMTPMSRETIKAKFLDGHKVDYVKNRVAFDLEWNSKDQTFDRDLYAFSAFSQCGVIDVGVLLTRGYSLEPVIRSFPVREVAKKYGASSTWMGKLLYRLNAGRNGSCPVLAFGIKPECIVDWNGSWQ